MSFFLDVLNEAKSGLAAGGNAAHDYSADLNAAGSSGHAASFSGYGGGGGSSYYGKCVYCCEEEKDDLLPLYALGAAATLFGLFFLANGTGSIAGKRDFGDTFMFDYNDYTIPGLEEFEDKIDQIAGGNNGGDNWISSLYNKFKGSFLDGSDNSIDSTDGLEPPVLDETWGISDVKNLYDNKEGEEGGSRKKRSAADLADNAQIDDPSVDEAEDDEYIKSLSGEPKCKAKFWRCVSKVAKGTSKYMDQPGGLTGMVQKTMFRMAFHGGFGNVWNALMTVPEARDVKRCFNAQEQCLNYEVLKAEAKMSGDNEKPRLIVNPDFVEGQDNSDGKRQWNEKEEEEFLNSI